MNVATKSRLEVIPLTEHIGAELRGLDLSQPLSEADVAAINKAWLDNIVILFRGQTLSQEDFLRLTTYFGPIGVLPDGEMMFHHDMIHSANPDAGTMLYSLEIPSQGGDTLFASGYAAYDTLDPELRNKLEGKRAKHHYNYGSTQKGDNKGTESFGESEHPIFRTHDQTGRKAVYVNRLMSIGIEGMDDAEAAPLLEKLFDHSEKPEFVYTHKWQVGDVLLWDNRCSTHARTDFPTTERRLMLRTTIECKVAPY